MLQIANINMAGHSFSLRYRPDTSDIKVLQQIFKNGEYELRRLRRYQEIMDRFKTLESPLIIDGGANIGASSCYFSQKFSGSRVVAIEPLTENFEILTENVQDWPVDCIQGALSSSRRHFQMADAGTGFWGYYAKPLEDGGEPENVPGMVSGITVPDLLSKYERSSPFIIKLDIEGGEDDLFRENTEWIDSFDIIIIELHDWKLTSSANSQNFLSAISKHHRDFVFIGENIYSIKNY